MNGKKGFNHHAYASRSFFFFNLFLEKRKKRKKEVTTTRNHVRGTATGSETTATWVRALTPGQAEDVFARQGNPRFDGLRRWRDAPGMPGPHRRGRPGRACSGNQPTIEARLQLERPAGSYSLNFSSLPRPLNTSPDHVSEEAQDAESDRGGEAVLGGSCSWENTAGVQTTYLDSAVYLTEAV